MHHRTATSSTRWLPDWWFDGPHLFGDPRIGLRPAVLLERKDRFPPQDAEIEIAVGGDQLVVPRRRHRNDLTLRIDDDRVTEQLTSVLDPCLGGRDRETGVLVTTCLDRQMRVKDPQV